MSDNRWILQIVWYPRTTEMEKRKTFNEVKSTDNKQKELAKYNQKQGQMVHNQRDQSNKGQKTIFQV